MKIGVVGIAYNLPEHTRRSITSAVSQVGNQVEYHLFLHSKDEAVVRVCYELARNTEVNFYKYGVNRGLATSWNEGIHNAFQSGCDTVVVVNDDCEFAPGDLDTLAEWAVERPDMAIVQAIGSHLKNKRVEPLGYSCFAINPVAIRMIGYFDQNCFPIYWEDIDYGWRLQVAGVPFDVCTETMVQHGGSLSIEQSADYERQHHQTFTANRDYYIRKWGGDKGSERWRTPFNDPQLTLKIAYHRRFAPYGDRYDRTDQGIVKL